MKHIPVMLNEVIDNLNIRPDGIYVDMTLGGGGHAKEVLKRLTTGKLIGIDRDEYAINKAKENLKDFNNKIIIKDNYKNLDKILKNLFIEKVDGIYIDLGISSFQLDDDRGFSYKINSRLDMRMDRDEKLDAYEVVNELSKKELYEIIKDYGEEKFASNIAKHIVIEREKKKIETTFELVEIIKQSIPAKVRQNEKHPAKRTFQAIRIYVNDELNNINETLEKACDLLKDKSRLLVITFQSLEDRLVKNQFKKFEYPCVCPEGYPCVCGKKSKGIIITKKPILPTAYESEINTRSHSAKLRIFERRENE